MMAQSKQGTKIIKVVVIAVAIGIIFYLFQQGYPAIEQRTEDYKAFEKQVRVISERPKASWELQYVASDAKANENLLREKYLNLRKEYLKLVGGSIATIIAAFFVIHYLTSAERKTTGDSGD